MNTPVSSKYTANATPRATVDHVEPNVAGVPLVVTANCHDLRAVPHDNSHDTPALRFGSAEVVS